MRLLTVIGVTAAAFLFAGCNSSVQSSGNSSLSPVSVLPAQPGGCYPLTQLIPFAGTATLSTTSARVDAGSLGHLAPGLVSGVVNSGTMVSYGGSGSDGAISFNAEGNAGLSAVQGILQISSAAWNQALAQLGGSQGQCVQSITFDLEVASSDSSGAGQNVLYGGNVVLTVNGTQISLAF